MAATNVKPSHPPIDFKVDTTTGVAYISQRKAAELCGVSQQAVSAFCLSDNIDTKHGLTDEILFLLVIHYALDSKRTNTTARATLKAFAYAGARAYIYTQVGYSPSPQAKPNKLHEPCVPVRWLCQQLGRSRSSVDRTLNVSIHRMRSFGLSAEVAYINAERCVSPALIICSMFTGKEMQRIRAWLLDIAETDALPDAHTLMQLTHP